MKFAKEHSSSFSISAPTSSIINWVYPTDKMYVISGQGTSTCTFGATVIGNNQLIKAIVTSSGIQNIYQKTINILNPSTTILPVPTIVTSAYTQSSILKCCGRTYIINSAPCSSNCNDLQYSLTFTNQRPEDIITYNENNGYFTIVRNSDRSFIVSSKARNKSISCSNPSNWSNSISRLYRTHSIFWGNYKNSNSLNNEIPIDESYVVNEKKLYVEKVDLDEWLDLKYGDRDLDDNEVIKISSLLSSKIPMEIINIKIFNFVGLLIEDKDYNENKFTHNLSNLTPGSYFVTYTYGGLKTTKQIIIN